MKKFLSNSLSGVGAGVGVPLGEGEVPTAGAVVVVVVVVAGDIPGTVAEAIGLVAGAVAPGAAGVVIGAVAGEVTGAVAGDMTGAVAGLVAFVGGGAGGLFAGGGWPNEVSARMTEKRLAISSVFIGLIKRFARARIPISGLSS
jgi:hypothetical protein